MDVVLQLLDAVIEDGGEAVRSTQGFTAHVAARTDFVVLRPETTPQLHRQQTQVV